MTTLSPAKQLDAFIARFTPEIAALTRGAIKEMRARLPGAVALVYDNYRGLVVGFCPGDRPSEVIFSIACYPSSVLLCFFAGDKLPDPRKLLRGSGKVARNLKLGSPDTLEDPAVKALMKAAMEMAPKPFDPRHPSRLVIQSISAKQLPRRPGETQRPGTKKSS